MNIELIEELIIRYGKDILSSPGMQSENDFIQHKSISVYTHSLSVAYVCLYITKRFHLKVDEMSLVRGALLHDYFLYDWHESDDSHKWHGFTHAKTALNNAQRDFTLNKIEKDMIRQHMFPLNIRPPKYRESIILCIADKICAAYETTRGLALMCASSCN